MAARTNDRLTDQQLLYALVDAVKEYDSARDDELAFLEKHPNADVRDAEEDAEYGQLVRDVCECRERVNGIISRVDEIRKTEDTVITDDAVSRAKGDILSYEWFKNMISEEIREELGTIANERIWANGSIDEETAATHADNIADHELYIHILKEAYRNATGREYDDDVRGTVHE